MGKYEGIACYVYPPEQTQQGSLFSSFIETTTSTSQPAPAPTAEPSPAPTNAPSSSPRSAKKGLLKVTEQEEQFPGDDMFISSTEEPFPGFMSSTEEPFEFADGIVIDDNENKRCPVFPVYAYWSNFYNNSVYIPHNKSPPR